MRGADDFAWKYDQIKEDIDQFNRQIERMAEKDKNSGCRAAFLTALPWGLYVFYIPAVMFCSFFDMRVLQKILMWLLPVPLLCSMGLMIRSLGAAKRHQREMELLYRKHLRKRTMPVLYPACRYEYGKMPMCAAELQAEIFLPRGRITCMGTLGNDKFQLHELSVDRSEIQGEGYFNVFHGVLGAVNCTDAKMTERLGKYLKERGRKIVFCEWNRSFVFLVNDLSFDQFMHHRYSKSRWSQNNPYAFRRLVYDEMERNYGMVSSLIQIIGGNAI